MIAHQLQLIFIGYRKKKEQGEMYCDGWDENDKRLTAKEAGLDCFHMKQTPNFSENSMPKLDNER